MVFNFDKMKGGHIFSKEGDNGDCFEDISKFTGPNYARMKVI